MGLFCSDLKGWGICALQLSNHCYKHTFSTHTHTCTHAHTHTCTHIHTHARTHAHTRTHTHTHTYTHIWWSLPGFQLLTHLLTQRRPIEAHPRVHWGQGGNVDPRLKTKQHRTRTLARRITYNWLVLSILSRWSVYCKTASEGLFAGTGNNILLISVPGELGFKSPHI